MDVQHAQAPGEETGQDRPKTRDGLQNHRPPHTAQEPQAEHKEAPDTLHDREAEKRYSDDSITDVVCTSDDALLLPNHKPMISQTTVKDDLLLDNCLVIANQPVAHPLQEGVANGTPPICTPPAASVVQVKPGSASASASMSAPATVQKSNGHHHHHHQQHPHKKPLPSSSKSQQSIKANAIQIQKVAGDDCCVHCVLACLFCEPMTCCSVFAQCLSCGPGCEALCCCGEAATGGLACGEDACSALLDCGILEDCCQSSDCLEICLECCAICFPA